MKIEQFVMAYSVEHDKIRSILPDGFFSLRPVLRINAEIRDNLTGYIELNTAVEIEEKRGWLNIGFWNEVPFVKNETSIMFKTSFLNISFIGTGVEGACPAEKDNAGCCFHGEKSEWRLPEVISANKEFCDCEFSWSFGENDAHGVSIGKTLPAIPTAVQTVYPRKEFTAKNAAAIPCKQVLGAYTVIFER